MSDFNDRIKQVAVTDVIIVGSGPTGLMAAALLARCGINIRIIDKTNQQAHESRAFAVQAKSLELLLSIGLAEEFLARGLITSGVQVCKNGKVAAELNFNDIGRSDTPYPFVLMVPQWDIEDILVKDLKKYGVIIEHNVELIDFDQLADCIVAEAKTKEGCLHFKSKYLIGADGAHSIVRKTLSLTFDGAPYPQGFLLADCKIDWPYDYEHFKIFMRERNFAVYLPLRGKDICRVIVVKSLKKPSSIAAKEASTAESSTLSEVQNALREATGENVTLTDARWVTSYRIHHRGVNKYREDRVFIAGDAAHIHSPAGGQGMNTGLQDAANLAWKLALIIKGNAPDSLLDTYNSERWPIGQKILNYSDKLFSRMCTQDPWQARMRNFLVPKIAWVIMHVKRCRARMFHFISQLGIRYHNNYFLYEDPTTEFTSKILVAGHRAPNALISRNCDVFSLITGYRFHVLVFSKKPLLVSEIETIHTKINSLPNYIGIEIKYHLIAQSLMGKDERLLRAENMEVFNSYGVTYKNPQAIFLIRPDGYIAYHVNALDFDKLEKFLNRFT